jgi:hypothetical protein
MWLFGNRKLELSNAELRPYVLKLREGYLIGLAYLPSVASPCVGCIQKWLLDRQIPSTEVEAGEWKVREDLFKKLAEESNPHICYEVSADGTETRLENCIFPHPSCDCQKQNHQLPSNFSWNLSFAFSPLTQIKCVRYTTPMGHIWLTSVSGKAVESGQAIRTYGTGASKEDSRKRAIEEWLKKASLSDFQFMHLPKRPIPAESFQNLGATQIRLEDPLLLGNGAGADYSKATLQAMYDLTKKRTLERYSNNLKNPILVVGSHAWLRNRMPFFMLQEYDWYILFYPNSSPCWVVGMAGFSRLHSDTKPIFVFDSHPNIETALDGAIGKTLEACRPDFDGNSKPIAPVSDSEESERARQKNLWWTHWIYRCSKISLKELQSMESYTEDLELWRSYYRDGQPAVSLVPGNTTAYPRQLVSLVQARLHEAKAPAPKVFGIGTSRDFQANWN